MTLEYYTDGACSNNGTWQGGWGYIKIDPRFEEEFIVVGNYDPQTTNNRMELKALLAALIDCCTNSLLNEDVCFNIYTDSAYISNCFSQGWYKAWIKNNWLNSKKQPVANQDLWASIIEYYNAIKHRVNILKVKGHDDNLYNEYADKIAVYCKNNQTRVAATISKTTLKLTNEENLK